MRLLSIGNSFSTDSHKWLAQIAANDGEYLYCANLFIGGCFFKRHWDNYLSGRAAYRLEINGESLRWISIYDALTLGEWDIITLQQVSGLSGDFSSFEPYYSNLYKLIRELQPNARILLHKTWSYEVDCTLEGFARYSNSQSEMYRAINKAYQEASLLHGLEIIPTGDVIQHIRETMPEFDYPNGGLSLNRDGFHLSWTYGRYIAGLVWYHTLFGKKISNINFVPSVKDHPVDLDLLSRITQNVQSYLETI